MVFLNASAWEFEDEGDSLIGGVARAFVERRCIFVEVGDGAVFFDEDDIEGYVGMAHPKGASSFIGEDEEHSPIWGACFAIHHAFLPRIIGGDDFEFNGVRFVVVFESERGRCIV